MPFSTRLNALIRTTRTDRDQLLAMFEHSPAMVLVLRGPDHVLEAANRRFRNLVPGLDLQGKAFREIFPTLADGPHHMRLDAVFGGGHTFEADGEPWWVAPTGDGRFERFDYVYVPLRAANGEVEGVGVLATDVTAARPARPPGTDQRDVLAAIPARPEPAPRPVDELFASLSFDLRTAAHVVMGYANILHQDGGELPARLLGASRVLAGLVSDVLDLEGLRTGQLTLERQPLCFTALMDAAILGLEASARAKGTQVITDLPASLPLLADHARLLRALTHTLDRAIEITPSGGAIRVKARVEGPSLVCEIAGEGLALPEAQALRLARTLVEIQGGKLEIPPGVGATCRLIFPLAG